VIPVFRQAVFAVVIVLLTPVVVSSQYKERDLSGVVSDARGNALPKVSVELENTRTLAVRSYITGKDGRYYFSGLNDDVDFTLKAKYRDWWSRPKTLSKFNSEAHPVIDLIIPID
jgi:hypothetical protein